LTSDIKNAFNSNPFDKKTNRTTMKADLEWSTPVF